MAYTRNTSETVGYHGKLTWSKAVPTVSNQVLTRTFPSSRSGSSMPDWRDKIRKRQNATTPYSLDSYKVVKAKDGIYSASGVLYNVPNVQVAQGLFNPINGNFAHLTADVNKAESTALTALYRKVNAQVSHTNVPKALVEFGDVIRQFGSPAKAILSHTQRHLNRLFLQRRGVSAVKYNSASYARLLSDTYLEYAFGLAPLINDTKKAAEALGRWTWEVDSDNVRLPPTKLVGRGSDSVAKTTVANFAPMAASGIVCKMTTLTTTEARAQYVCGYNTFLTADLGSLDRLHELLGFRPESWLPAVWEGVPWSWLIDYFTNVGAILDSVEASHIKPTWISKTVSTVTDVQVVETLNAPETARVASYNYWKNPSSSGSQGAHTCRRTTMERTNPTTLGLPSVYFQLPTGLRQFAALAAVTVQKLRSSPPVISLETDYRSMDAHIYKRELRTPVVKFRK